MKNNVWVRTTIQAIHEILYFLPVLIILNHTLLQIELVVTASSLFLAYLLGFALGKLKLIRFLEWLYCLLIAIVITVVIVGINWHGAVCVVLTFIATIRGFRFRYSTWDEMFGNNIFITCIAIYFVTPAIFMFFPELKIYSTYLYWAGLYCVIHALFTLNSKQLDSAAMNKQAGQSIAKNILRVNRVGTAIVVVVLIIMMNINSLIEIVRSWVTSIFDWINELLSKPTPEPTELENLPPESAEQMPMELPKGRSALAEFFDMLVLYAGYIIEVLIAIGILYFVIFKLLIPLFSRFVSTAKLTRELEAGYLDEEEKLEAPKLGQWIRDMMTRKPTAPVPEDNEERIRFLYKETIQAAMKRGLEIQKSQTPLEIERDWQIQKAKHRLPTGLMSLYNKVRYGESKITDEEAKNVRELD